MLKKLKFIAKNSAIYSVGNMATKLAGIILLPIYAKNISIALFGLLSLFDVIVDLVLSVNGTGVGRALTRWYWDKEYKDKRKSLVFTAYIYYLVTGLLFLLLTYFILTRFQLQIFQTEVPSRILNYFIVSLLFRTLIFMPMQVQRIQQKALVSTALSIVNLIFSLAFTIYFLIFLKMDLEGVLLARIIGSGVVFILLIPFFFTQIKYRIEWPALVSMLKFSWPLVISDLSSMVLALSNRFIINLLGTLENVGSYAIAFRVSNVINVFIVNSFSQAYVHIFFKSMGDENPDRLYKKTLTYFVFVAAFFSLALSLFAKELMQLFSLGNENYWRSFQLIPILILGIIVNGMRRQMVLVMMKEQKTKIILVFTAIVALLNIGINFILIPVWGNYGAAVSNLISQSLLFTMNYLYIKKRFQVTYEIKKTIIIIINFLVLYGISMLLYRFPIAVNIILKFGLIISFPLLLIVFNFYEPIELLRIKQSWRKWRNPLRWKENLSKVKLR